jgi:ABC-type phosphate transport system substrate-binding protein
MTRRGSTLLVAIAFFGLPMVGWLSTADAAGELAVASPAAALLDGQYVAVTWAGFEPSTEDALAAVSVSQCKVGASIPNTDCSESELGVTGRDGVGHARLRVRTGTLESKDFSQSFHCGHETPCTIAVYVDPFVALGSGSPSATTDDITFAFPPDGCPHNASGIAGTGAEAPNRAILTWQSGVCQPPDSIDVQYTRTESHEGRDAFVNNLPGAAFAATSVPFTDAEKQHLTDEGRGFAYAPLTASAAVFTINGTDRYTGQKLTGITLTPAMLARIFNGKRNSFPTEPGIDAESDEILELNPQTSFYPNLQAFGRLEKAASTLELTSFMVANAPAAWKDLPPWVANRPSASGGANETADYEQPTSQMPTGLQGPGAQNQLLNGPDILATTLAGKGPNGDDLATTRMGYVDSSTAAFYGLPTVCIQLDPDWKTTGSPCVAATTDNITRALAVATRNADGTVTPDFKPGDPLAYPLLDVSYAIAPQGWSDQARATTLSRFLRYAASNGQGPTLPAGYAPLPADLRAKTSTAADTNYAPAPPAPATESEAETPASPRAVPTPMTQPPAVTTGTTTPVSPTATSPRGVEGSRTPLVTPKQPVESPRSITAAKNDVDIPSAGGRLSSRASWALLVALTVLTGSGLLLRPGEWLGGRLSFSPVVEEVRA